ncbi:KTSC domain-containing protein [Oenococcus sp. UCMA 17063]|nr:KTSC domain-containing protein [Oenococcus sp. UCMA 17063]
MEFRKVMSSDINHVGYDQNTGKLTIVFHNGRVYSYHNIGFMTYYSFINATSIGRYFAIYIKHRPCHRGY